jgi:hypothetical protein
MLHLLSNNILKYVLNQYLDYKEDIIKLKQLYNIKFSIKVHITYKKYHHGNVVCYNVFLDEKLFEVFLKNIKL